MLEILHNRYLSFPNQQLFLYQAYRDEIYNFRSVLTPEKESLAVPLPVPAALQPVVVPSPATFIDEDSLDAPPSIGSQVQFSQCNC